MKVLRLYDLIMIKKQLLFAIGIQELPSLGRWMPRK